MLKNSIINRGVIRKIALALGSLNAQVVYVGGATVSFYINDPAAEDVRPTKAPEDVKSYLNEQLRAILYNRVMQEAIYGNLFYETREERYQRIIEGLQQIVNWS